MYLYNHKARRHRIYNIIFRIVKQHSFSSSLRTSLYTSSNYDVSDDKNEEKRKRTKQTTIS